MTDIGYGRQFLNDERLPAPTSGKRRQPTGVSLLRRCILFCPTVRQWHRILSRIFSDQKTIPCVACPSASLFSSFFRPTRRTPRSRSRCGQKAPPVLRTVVTSPSKRRTTGLKIFTIPVSPYTCRRKKRQRAPL